MKCYAVMEDIHIYSPNVRFAIKFTNSPNKKKKRFGNLKS